MTRYACAEPQAFVAHDWQVSWRALRVQRTRFGGPTFGGYSSSLVVEEAFVLRFPTGLDLAASAPLLCAGNLPLCATAR
jgi:D-arabinose 1-dehydrogenase-like Zn-dependent alcohol dehydrogenase